VAQLEVPLLLHQERDRDWSAQEVAKALYTADDMCSLALSDWLKRDLLCVASDDPRYRYQPATAQLDALVAELADLYKERRVTVISRIYAKPVDRVRTFSDAFRLRGSGP
jgi:hypothetical protein